MRFLASVLFTSVLAACASYTPSSAPVPKPSLEDWVIQQDIAVAADPYADEERQVATFDANLNDADVIAIQVVVENRGERSIVVRPSDMILELPGGKTFSSSGVTTVVSKVGESGSVVGATIAFGIVGALIASDAEDEARTARIADYKEKAFKDSTLRSGQSEYGFVFFIPPRGTNPFDEANLLVRVVDFDLATSEIVEVALSGMGYEETVSKKKKKNEELR